MNDLAIYELAASQSSLLAAAFAEKRVQVWDVTARQKIADFPTVFHFGAHNLALSPCGKFLADGCSTASGVVALYEVHPGKHIWEKRTRYPTRIRFGPASGSVFWTREATAVIFADEATGVSAEEMKGVYRYFPGPKNFSLVVPAQRLASLSLAGGVNASIQRSGFAVLDAAFSTASACIAEARGYVRCFNCLDGHEEWRFDPGPDLHVIKVHYPECAGAFFGIEVSLSGVGLRSLVKFLPDGTTERMCSLRSWAETFLGTADQLLTNAGEILNILDGQCVGRMPLPTKDD